MNGIIIIISFVTVAFTVVSHGYSLGRLRGNTYPQNSLRDFSCSCTCEDLGALVALIRALEEKDCGSNYAPAPIGSLCNAEELIMNLVNALIELSTQALSQRHCHCPSGSAYNNNPSYPHNGGSGNNYPGNSNHNPGSGYSHSDGGLLDLDLLNPNKKDNVLDLDLARQHLLGVGLGGGGGSQGSNGYYNGRNANGNDEGLNVDLLNPDKQSNVADVELGNQQLVGVGLGGGGGLLSQPTNGGTASGSSSSGPKSGEGLVNVDVLDPNKKNNVADVDIDRHSVIGIGLGN